MEFVKKSRRSSRLLPAQWSGSIHPILCHLRNATNFSGQALRFGTCRSLGSLSVPHWSSQPLGDLSVDVSQNTSVATPLYESNEKERQWMRRPPNVSMTSCFRVWHVRTQKIDVKVQGAQRGQGSPSTAQTPSSFSVGRGLTPSRSECFNPEDQGVGNSKSKRLTGGCSTVLRNVNPTRRNCEGRKEQKDSLCQLKVVVDC